MRQIMTAILPLKGVGNCRWKGTSTPTFVGVRKLQCVGYLTVKTCIANNASAVYKLNTLKAFARLQHDVYLFSF